ncbi:unnamed protein product [Citrullus colocynthis]|uniref:Flavin-containing monooxygenase n=1 Tax=Citrullus colocynthis TaxID=252529 RepID=A0ABP0YWJ3_9ROSI
MEAKKVAIIGAGLSGLVACKFILSKGLIPIVFDARGTIGGIWNQTLKSTTLQTTKHMFRTSDSTLESLVSTMKASQMRRWKVGLIGGGGGGSGNPFTERSKWRLSLVDARTNVPLQNIAQQFPRGILTRISNSRLKLNPYKICRWISTNVPSPLKSTWKLLFEIQQTPEIKVEKNVFFTFDQYFMFGSEMLSRWLAEFMDRKFKLPSIMEMEKDIANWEKCLKLYSGPGYK